MAVGLHDWTHCERSVQTGFGQIHIFYIDFMPAYCWSLLIFISGGSQRKMVKKMQNINTTPERGKKTISIFTSLLCWQAKRPYVNLIIIIQKLNIKIPEKYNLKNNKRSNNNLYSPVSLNGGGCDFSALSLQNTNIGRQRSPVSQGETWEQKPHLVLHRLRGTVEQHR